MNLIWLKLLENALGRLKKNIVREQILNSKTRIDGRKLDEVRKISCETGILPRTHGSALFTRGETQALVAITLGTSEDEQMIDSLKGFIKKSLCYIIISPTFLWVK